MRAAKAGVVFVGLMMAMGCTDKAQPSYAACVQADTAGDIGKAWDACNAAVGADPTSTAGKAAAEKMTALKPKHDAWLADQKAKAEAAAAVERAARDERRKAEAEARAQAAAAARRKVRKLYNGREPDGMCTGKGLPPYQINYEGGSYAEDEMVALADKCQHLYPGKDPSSDGVLFVIFCCPE